MPGRVPIEENFSALGIKSDVASNIEHFGRYLGEFLSGAGDQLIEKIDVDEIKKVIDAGRGVLTVTAHYGNWELAAVGIGKVFGGISVVIRTTGDPFLDKRILRCRGSNHLLDVADGVRSVVDILSSGGVVAAAIDEPQVKGTEVTFFGRKIIMAAPLFNMARRANAAIIPTLARRNASGKIEIKSYPEAKDEQEVAARFEEWIREDPTQWVLMRKISG